MELWSSSWLIVSNPVSNAASCRLFYGASSPSSVHTFCSCSSVRGMVLKAKFRFGVDDERVNHRKVPNNLRYPRRTKLPPDPCLGRVSSLDVDDDVKGHNELFEEKVKEEGNDAVNDGEYRDIMWEQDEIEAISSLFKGRIPQRPGNLDRQRPLPLPLPYKTKPTGLPTQKRFSRKSVAVKRQSLPNQLYKNPTFLIGLAREIKGLPPDEKIVALVLNKWARFLRKGSLSMTVRELGHMGLPERALLVFCWAQKQPHLYPDDRILASTVEVLARSHELKMPYKFNDDRFMSNVSQSVYEAMVRGFIKGGSLGIAWKLLSAVRNGEKVLESGLYAKLILELGKNPDKKELVSSLLEDLAGREDLNLNSQDCTAIMKVCIRLGKFQIVEALYDWIKKSGHLPSVVMYTTVIHSRCSEKRYREALTVVWEMEASSCLFDLPAYRVAIKLFVALNDLPRAVRYFAKLKEAGFSPTFDVYVWIIQMYMDSGRIAKCKEVWLEAEMAGFKLDEKIRSQLFEFGK